MEPELTNAEMLREFSGPGSLFYGLGILITGSSKEKRAEMVDQAMALIDLSDRTWIAVTFFEFIAGYHFGLHDRFRGDDILVIKDLAPLSQAESDAVDVISPVWDPVWLLGSILDGREGSNRITLITTEYEIADLEGFFGPRVASLANTVGFSIRV